MTDKTEPKYGQQVDGYAAYDTDSCRVCVDTTKSGCIGQAKRWSDSLCTVVAEQLVYVHAFNSDKLRLCTVDCVMGRKAVAESE